MGLALAKATALARTWRLPGPGTGQGLALGQGLAYDLSRVGFAALTKSGRGPFASAPVVLNGRVDRRGGRGRFGVQAVERERELAESHGISLAFQPFGTKRPVEPIVE